MKNFNFVIALFAILVMMSSCQKTETAVEDQIKTVVAVDADMHEKIVADKDLIAIAQRFSRGAKGAPEDLNRFMTKDLIQKYPELEQLSEDEYYELTVNAFAQVLNPMLPIDKRSNCNSSYYCYYICCMLATNYGHNPWPCYNNCRWW